MSEATLGRLARLAARSGASTSYLIEAIVLNWLETRRDQIKAARTIVKRQGGVPKMRRWRASQADRGAAS